MTSATQIDILLVEDDPRDVELTLRALRRVNVANPIEVAGDGVEALEFLFAEAAYAARSGLPLPRLVLLDLKLPRLDGIGVLRRLRADERTKTIPIVVLTSSREDRDIAECYRLGANSYIVKPVEFEKFVEAVAGLGMYWLLLNEPPR